MKTIPRDELNDCLNAPDPYLLVEVLGEAAFDANHLPYAINVPLGRGFADRLADVAPDPDTPLLFYGNGPEDPGPAEAAMLAERKGYRRVAVYPEGKSIVPPVDPEPLREPTMTRPGPSVATPGPARAEAREAEDASGASEAQGEQEEKRSATSMVTRFLVRRLVKRYVPGLNLYLAARDLMKAVALQRSDATAPSTRRWAWTAAAGSTMAATFVPVIAPVGGVVGAAASHVRDSRVGDDD